MKASLLANGLMFELGVIILLEESERESLACWNAALDELLDFQQLCEGELIFVEALDWHGAHATANINAHLPFTDDRVSWLCLCCIG